MAASEAPAAWARIDVLVLDDFAMQPVTDAQAADLLEVIEDRSDLRSTIVTSQLPVALWHEHLGEPTVADAILDRLLHGAHRVECPASRCGAPSRSGPSKPPWPLSACQTIRDTRRRR